MNNILEEVRKQKLITERSKTEKLKRYPRRESKLDKHKTEIFALRDAGASLNEIRRYLSRRRPSISTSRSNIDRYLKKSDTELRSLR